MIRLLYANESNEVSTHHTELQTTLHMERVATAWTCTKIELCYANKVEASLLYLCYSHYNLLDGTCHVTVKDQIKAIILPIPSSSFFSIKTTFYTQCTLYIQCCCQLYIPVPMLIAQENFSRQWLYWIWKSSASECERFNLYENAEPRMNAVYRNHVDFETKIMKIYVTMWQVQLPHFTRTIYDYYRQDFTSWQMFQLSKYLFRGN